VTSGRALTLVLAIGGGALLWTGVRYAKHVESTNADAASAAPATIRFFKDPAPIGDFTAVDLDGRKVSTADYRGKVTIVNFWATWCPPCRAEIPDLIALQEKYRDRLQIIAISEDESPAEEVRQFAKDHHFNFPVVMTTPAIEKLFPTVRALPTSFVFDAESRLVQKHVGMLPGELAELETRSLAGLAVQATIERVEQTQGLTLGASAQAMDIPGVDLAALPPARRTEALQKLNSQSCTCGCDLTIARCRVDDPTCGVSLPIARQIVKQIAERP
jgi:thiol-disulfide isomerase/thioredoxin